MPFPTTSVLDNFNRANESPLSGGGNWAGPIISTDQQAVLSGSAATGTAGAFCDSYWTPATYQNVEVFATLSTAAADNTDFQLWWRVVNPNVAGSTDGYEFTIDNNGAPRWRLYRVDNDVTTQLGSTSATAYASGDRAGADMVGSTIRVFNYTGGAWQSAPIITQTDSTYTAAGYIGLMVNGTTWVIDDFGGGSIGFQPLPYLQQNFPSMAGYSDRPQKWN